MAELISPSIVGEFEKWLIYGDPGMGKTHLALTIPEPIYFLSIGGHNEAKTYYSKKFQEKHGKKVIYLDIAEETFDVKAKDFNPASGVDNVRRLLEAALNDDDKGIKTFSSIIIDNATFLSEFMMNKAIEVSKDSQDGSEKGYSTYKKYLEHGILTPFDSDWNAEMGMMMKFVSGLFRLKKHIAFVAHEYETTKANRKTQSSDVLAIKPLFIGKNRDKIANKFDNVWRMTKSGPYFIAQTVPSESPTIIAKSRIGGVIDDEWLTPDLTEAIRLYKEYADSLAA